jgi:hypothetical protein
MAAYQRTLAPLRTTRSKGKSNATTAFTTSSEQQLSQAQKPTDSPIRTFVFTRKFQD